jgi:Zn-dependent peptidase ImmA (M78 family)
LEIKDTVLNLVEKYGTRNPMEIADYLGFIVQKHDLGKYSGYYIEYEGVPCICINSRITDTKYSDIVLAHEVGHGVLHKGTECMFFGGTFFSKAKPEQEANIFTAELLIPDKTILENPGMSKKELAGLTGYREKLFDFKIIGRRN